MPTNNTRTRFFDVGVFLRNVYAQRKQDIIDGLTLGAVVLSSANGYRQLSWTSTKPGTTNNHFLMLTSLAATEVAQAYLWVNTPNWNFQCTEFISTGGTAPWNSFTNARVFWQQNYVAYKQALIDNWTTSFISSQLVHEISYGANIGYMAAASYQITCDSWVYTDPSYIAIASQSTSPVWAPIDEPIGPSSVPGSGAGWTSGQAQKLVDSAQQIADTDYNISINHGQSIFSVKGKVLT